MRRQAGLTLTGLLFGAILFGFAALVLARVTPALIEYWQIKKTIAAIVKDPDAAGNPAAARKAFERRATVENIVAIGPNDLDIRKENGGLTISFAYEKRVPLAGNVSLVFDFQGSSRED